MRIDAHQHYWSLVRADYGWLRPELAHIYRDFGPADLAPILARNGIDRTILVQAAPTVAETEWLLALAEREPTVAGVVGWVDIGEPDAASIISRLVRRPELVGIRPMIHDIADRDWMLSAGVDLALRAVQAFDLVFDALVRPPHLPRLTVLADRHPALTIVVDHAAKPDIANRRFDLWRADMAALAQRQNVAVKLSGLVTEAGPSWTAASLAPVVDHLLTVFGPRRILWGSDWPVLELAATYDDWCAATGELLANLTEGDRSAILGGNAARIYLSRRGRR